MANKSSRHDRSPIDTTKMEAPKGQEDLRDALGNLIINKKTRPTDLKSELLSKKELREQKQQAKKKPEAQGAEARCFRLIKDSRRDLSPIYIQFTHSLHMDFTSSTNKRKEESASAGLDVRGRTG